MGAGECRAVGCGLDTRQQLVVAHQRPVAFAYARIIPAEYGANIHPARIHRTALQENNMLKVIGWIVAIIFLIGLLVVTGVFKMIIPG